MAVGRVWREVEGSLSTLPSERTDEPALPGTSAGDALDSAHPSDELAHRRKARATG